MNGERRGSAKHQLARLFPFDDTQGADGLRGHVGLMSSNHVSGLEGGARFQKMHVYDNTIGMRPAQLGSLESYLHAGRYEETKTEAEALWTVNDDNALKKVRVHINVWISSWWFAS